MPVLNLSPEADTYVSENAPATNFGSETYLEAGLDFNGIARSRIWLRFDLSSIPSGSNITSAALGIFVFLLKEYPTSIYDLRRSTNITWGEGTITWNNAPDGTVSATITDSETSNEVFEVLTFTVTSDVSSALSTGKVSWRISVSNDSSVTVQKGIRAMAREYPGATYPILTVIYTTSNPTDTHSFDLYVDTGKNIEYNVHKSQAADLNLKKTNQFVSNMDQARSIDLYVDKDRRFDLER